MSDDATSVPQRSPLPLRLKQEILDIVAGVTRCDRLPQ